MCDQPIPQPFGIAANGVIRQMDARSSDSTGAPVLDGSIAHFDCEVAQEYNVGSHSILIGNVLSCKSRPGSPLGYFNGGFHDFGIHVD